jgi:hypothetical protein
LFLPLDKYAFISAEPGFTHALAESTLFDFNAEYQPRYCSIFKVLPSFSKLPYFSTPSFRIIPDSKPPFLRADVKQLENSKAPPKTSHLPSTFVWFSIRQDFVKQASELSGFV